MISPIEFNLVSGVIYVCAMLAIELLMILVYKRTLFRTVVLGTWTTFTMLSLRWPLAIIFPDFFGARASYLVGVLNIIATICVVLFATIAWHDYIREGKRIYDGTRAVER